MKALSRSILSSCEWVMSSLIFDFFSKLVGFPTGIKDSLLVECRVITASEGLQLE